jgi:tetratricopeptide (TPR) repeat protein
MLAARVFRAVVLSALFVACAARVVAQQAGQQSSLGSVDFPVTGPAEARANFLRGVAALHSFWFEEALEAFRESTRVAPDFAMGYWGEAMAYNHPLWAEQDTEAGRRALANIKDTSKLTARERAYVEAVRVLYGDGDKLARDTAYAAAMERLYRAYPEDLEAASFYALSLLGTVRPGDRGFSRQMKAGAVALDVYRKNPNHPGAAHYIIHAFDDPEHAILALPAARRYAEIAPEAHHARHMPSHIFIQLGMWADAARSNESSWAASEAWVRRKNLSNDLRDYHSLHWLTYAYLQQGRYAKAREALQTFRSAVAEGESARAHRGLPLSAAAFVVETERWDAADELFNPAEPKPATNGVLQIVSLDKLNPNWRDFIT